MFKYMLLHAALLLAASAQTPADSGLGPTSPTAVPLDGGASLLLAGDVIYDQRRQR